jgi:hypothetical protein
MRLGLKSSFHVMPGAEWRELKDAPGSGPSGGNTVEVRVLFSAPNGTILDLFEIIKASLQPSAGSCIIDLIT